MDTSGRQYSAEKETPERKQVVPRVAAILTAVARHGRSGARLIELARDTGIARPTVHRLLGELRLVGYVEQLPSKKYTLGHTLAELGLSAPSPIRNLVELQSIAQRLSDRCGDTVYVSTRIFDAAYYLVRTEGAYPVRAQSVEIGEAMPLAASYSGLVFLAQLNDAEREQHIVQATQNMPDQQWQELTEMEQKRRMREALRHFDDEGYIYGHDVVVSGVSGIAVPIPTLTGTPYAAVSISGINTRFRAEREKDLLAMIRDTADQLSEAIREPIRSA